MVKKKPMSAARQAMLRFKEKQRQAQEQQPQNFLPDAQPGCHVVHKCTSWIVGLEKLSGADDCTDIVVDPDSHLFSVYNRDTVTKSFYVSLNCRVKTKNGKVLAEGCTRTLSGEHEPCTTFVLVVQGKHIMDIGYLVLKDDTTLQDLQVESDIKHVDVHPNPDVLDDKNVYGFPLEGEKFMCTQGFNGLFTHFFPGTCHALDLACDIGTPVLAIGDGVVKDIQQKNVVSGIHVRNLFKWNSLMIQLDNGSFAEYVHIKTGSCVVSVGERVRKGQKICESGDIGFCPTPHLHIQIHDSAESSAPTVRFAFRDANDQPYVPEAGQWCGPEGLICESSLEV